MSDHWRMLKLFVLFSTMILLTAIIACGGSPAESETPDKQATGETKEAPAVATVDVATPVVVTGKLAPLPAGGKRGGELRSNANPGEPRDLDFMTAGPGTFLIVTAPVYSGMLRINPEDTNEIIGDLASTWEPSADGSSFIFHLREGIKWHDGTPFTSADVKATFDRALDPDFNSSRFANHVKKHVKQVDIIDENTVSFVKNSPGLLLLPTLASNFLMVVSKTAIDEDTLGEKANGTGPFKFVDWERDVALSYERNDDYFEDGLPFLDSRKILQISDRATLIGAMVSDQLDMWLFTPARPADLDRLKEQMGDKIKTVLYPNGVNQTFIMNTKRAPFDDIRVRRAVFLALDRQDYLDKVWRGQGVAGAVLDPAIYGDVAIPMEEVNKQPGIRQPKDEDIAEAKRLMAEAGFADGITLEDNECLGQNTAQGRLYVEVPIAQLRQVLNIDCKIVLQDRPSVFSRISEGDFSLYGHGNGVQFKDPDSIFGLIIAPSGGRNWGKWEHPDFTALYNEQVDSTDAARRRELHGEMQTFVYQVDTGHVPMTWNHANNVMRTYVNGWKSLGPWFDHNRMDRVWIDKGS
jgi:peptide/nickel transport system substrate-binding protein